MTNEKLDLYNALQAFSETIGDNEAVFCFTLSEGSDAQILHLSGNQDVLMTGLAGIENPSLEVKAMQTLICIMATSIAHSDPELGKMLAEDLAELLK